MAEMEHTPESNVLLFPQIVKKVFQFLPAKSLCNLARVCKLWRDEGAIVLHQRRQYCWQLFEHLDKTCHHYDHSEIWRDLQDFLQELSFRPTTVLVFLTGELWEGEGGFQKRGTRTGKRMKKDRDLNLSKNLPLDCRVMWSVTSGIIGTSADLSQTEEVEFDAAAAVLCFGHHPGVQIVPCKSSFKPSTYFDQLFQTFNSPSVRPELLDVKALLLIPHSYSYHSSPVDRNSTDRCEKFQRPLLVGGIANNCFIHGPTLDESAKFLLQDETEALLEAGEGGPESTTSCVAPQYGLCGLSQRKSKSNYLGQILIHGEQVEVACVILPPEVGTEELGQVEEVVLKLKDMSKHFPTQNSIAFMFACCARGRAHYVEDNVESAAFRKHFPNTPLLGFFGNGEIGCQYPYENGQSLRLVHSYTTFLVLICFP